MYENELWKYCTTEQCMELLLSLHLLGDTSLSRERQIACLYALSRHGEKHYRAVPVIKSDGTVRPVLAPDPLLKRIQQNILHNVLEHQPISPYGTAYRKGSGILCNAEAHIGQKKILKLDLENFFGTITFSMIYRKAFPAILFPPSVRTLLTNLCCFEDVLPQGAPTSPALSNIVMKPFDDYVGKWCTSRGINYSRYCDDMTFSGDFDHVAVKRKMECFLKEMGFALNEKKTKVLSESQRQSVTGIVVNSKAQVSSGYRKQLRQELYYCGKYGVVSHLMNTHRQDLSLDCNVETVQYLRSLLGKVNYVLYVNPQDSFFLREKKNVIKWLEEQSLNIKI